MAQIPPFQFLYLNWGQGGGQGTMESRQIRRFVVFKVAQRKRRSQRGLLRRLEKFGRSREVIAQGSTQLESFEKKELWEKSTLFNVLLVSTLNSESWVGSCDRFKERGYSAFSLSCCTLSQFAEYSELVVFRVGRPRSFVLHAVLNYVSSCLHPTRGSS